jgi:hypothetical protein
MKASANTDRYSHTTFRRLTNGFFTPYENALPGLEKRVDKSAISEIEEV